jgi:trehalose synthase
MHNALQGKDLDFSKIKREIYESVIFQNSIRNFFDHEFVIVHDPQPLALISHYKKQAPWIWRCHIDLSRPHRELWNYFVQFAEQYDAVIFSIPEYTRKLKTPELYFPPAIDPFITKNRQLTEREMDERLAHYKIPTDLPIVAQISRFDPWKDPKGVIKAFKIARKEVDCTLVLLGNFASDDLEGAQIYEEIVKSRDERILILPHGDDTALVNSLQQRADVVLQKSLREGFGLTVAVAMWKERPVIGGNAGGIRCQIQDGENGFLVSSVKEAAHRIVQLLKDKNLRKKMGHKAKESVANNFLLSRYLEQYLDLFNSFETTFHLKRSGRK